MASSSRGFTLMELMIALVVFAIAAGAISKFALNSQRLSQAQVEIIAMQSNLRTGILVVPTELRELAASGTGSDILAMASTSITFRAMRGVGFMCQISPTEIRLLDTGSIPFYGTRVIIAGRDSVIVFVENDPDDSLDDAWLVLQPTAVDLASTCGVNAAVRLTFNDFSGLLTNGVADLQVGGPVRSFEVMQLAQMTSGGATWLGARSVSGGQATLQPVLGPLQVNGLLLEYFTGTGVATTAPTAVRQIRITLRGLTQRAVSRTLEDSRAFLQDSLITTVTLRNAG
ncbi:MAG: prepilin-type N-terminal cleavage/methylation domain-containing protein [Gemmatimonadales bacterium]